MASRGRIPRWARNPRRAYDHDGIEIRPVRIGDMMRDGGVLRLRVFCQAIGCRHWGHVEAGRFPPETYIPDTALRLRCSRCGARRTAQVMPEWKEWTSPDWPGPGPRPGS